VNFDQRTMELTALWAARDNRQAAEVMLAELDPDDFTAPDTRTAFDAIRSLMAQQDDAAGWPGLLREMRVRGAQAPEVFMSDLTLQWVAWENFPALLREIRRARQLRDVRHLALGVIDETRTARLDAPEIARRLESEARSILERGATREPVRLSEVRSQMLLTGQSPAMATGLPDLDRHVAIREGNLVTVGARPGIGKSALLLGLARAASENGWQSLFFSFEMTAGEMRARLDLQGGFGTDIWLQESLRGHDNHLAVQAIAGRFIRRYADQPTAVFIDYLQLLKPVGRYSSRREQVGEVVRELKRMAMALKCPVIIAAQLNRNADDPSRPPRSSDLKETGDIEEASDVILLLHRPNFDTPETKMRVDKNRHGPSHQTVNLLFLAEQARFVSAMPPGADPFSNPEEFFHGR